MKTRWLPGKIKMPQDGSFEPIEGMFEPGNDPRAASFDECQSIFVAACNVLCDKASEDDSVKLTVQELGKIHRVPYEFPISYENALAEPLHTASNVSWALNDDLDWLRKARKLLAACSEEDKKAIKELVKAKIQVKIYRTDRALTGKDKTNRAKRWEVLAGDFQHATLEECWSAERKLTADLVAFVDFPQAIKESFANESLVPSDKPATLCPVTFEELSWTRLARALLDAKHGVSDYQVGHLHPLKRQGKHDGENVCWQSEDGNRIQGDLTIEETLALLDQIQERRGVLATS